VDSTGVYIADTDNHRILYYAGTSTTATRVYGQLNFTSRTTNNGGITANSLNSPSGVAVDNNGVYVADYRNHRVLYYTGTGTTATRVYGQGGSFTSDTGNKDGISANSLYYSQGVASDGVGLYIADTDNNRVLYYADKDIVPPPPPPASSSGTVKLLANPVRVASTLAGDGLNSPKLTASSPTPPASVGQSTVEFTIGGKNNIPANATGIFGVLTNVGCSGGANFRFFTDTTVPNAANLNVPGANSALNLSTNFIAPLSGGKVKLGLGSGASVTCGYVLDVSGYTTAPSADSDKVTLLANTVRVASTLASDNLNSPKLTASTAVPAATVGQSTVEFSIGGKNNIPADAKGIIGVLTNVGCNGGANFRFFVGTTVPNAANLNVPGALSSLNLSTGFIAALDGGKVKLGLGSGQNVTCGYVLDIVGYINVPSGGGSDLNLLPATVRVNSTLAPQNNTPLTSVGAVPANPASPSALEISGATVNGIPAGAKGILGVLTNVGCTGGGNFRFWTGATVPNAANLNIPGAFSALNLSTGFTTGLDSSGKVKLGLASGQTVTCGYVTDVVGFLN
jgi:NHL repeat